MLVGCGAIAVGIFGKNLNFYAADVETGAPFKQKSSRWSGRTVFAMVGVFMLAIGIKLLFWP
jgi:hypothetical protein